MFQQVAVKQPAAGVLCGRYLAQGLHRALAPDQLCRGIRQGICRERFRDPAVLVEEDVVQHEDVLDIQQPEIPADLIGSRYMIEGE